MGLQTDSTASPYGVNHNRVIKEVHNQIVLLDSGNTALLTLLRKLRKENTTQMRFNWFEDEFPQQYCTTAGIEAGSSGDETLVVTTGEGKYGRSDQI